MRGWALAILLGALQSGQNDVAGLIKRLGSDRIDVRDAAAKKLRQIGKPAVAELKKATQDPDVSLASWAKVVLEQIETDSNPLLHPDAESMNQKAPAKFRVAFSTSKGDFVLRVTRDWAPLGADRFYNLVKNGFYDDCRFFRVLPGFVVQFGIPGEPAVAAAWKAANLEDDPPKEKNTRGRITFATGGPRTRTTQLFINFADNSRLDAQGFVPFGEVISGMDVVDKLNSEYGEGAPKGKGPDQRRIHTEGNKFLKEEFERLDYIKSAKTVE